MTVILLPRNERGEWYIYSFGGYHVDDDDRTVLQADSQGGPTFRSSPIDVHACDVGELSTPLVLIQSKLSPFL